METNSFLEFLDQRIQYLNKSKRFGTAYNYRRAKTSLMKYLRGADLPFHCVDSGFVDRYSDWLLEIGNVRNSVSFHMRVLRATYNKGVKQGLVDQTYPFRDVYTGVDKTRKRCISKEILRKIIKLDLHDHPQLEMARDIYLFSIYARGISFIDIAYLKKTSIEGDTIVYRRKKTKQLLCIRIEKQLKGMIKKYIEISGDSPYLFPIIKETEPAETYRLYLCALSHYNSCLKKLSEKLSLPYPLTSYTARHTWASLAKCMDIPVSVISESMGHTSESTTRIYLASLDNTVIDKANRKVLKLLDSLVSN